MNNLLSLGFLLSGTVALSLTVSLSLRLGLALSISRCLLLLLTTDILVLFLCIDFTLLQLSAVCLNVLVCHIEVLLWVLDPLVNDREDELLRSSKLFVDHSEALILALDVGDDVLLAHTQVVHLDVEVNLDLVDRTLKQDHLLALLLVVDLLALWHLVALIHLEVVLAKGALGLLNFGLLTLVLAAVHDLLSAQLVDLLLAQLSLDLSLLSPLVSVCLMDLSLPRSTNGGCGCFGFVLRALIIATLIHVVKHLVLSHVLLLPRSNLAFKDFLELVYVVGEEVRHLGNPEGGDIGSCSHCLDGELLEVEDVIELFLNLV